MSLNSVPFLATVLALAVLAAGVTVWVWPRLASNRVGDVLGRVGLLLLGRCGSRGSSCTTVLAASCAS